MENHYHGLVDQEGMTPTEMGFATSTNALTGK